MILPEGRGREQDEQMPRVSVVIVTWNRAALLRECLEALERQTFRDFETIVIDNGSTDDSVQVVRDHFSSVRLITLLDNVGFSKGNNIGIRESRGTYIALLNNDAVATPGWLEALVSSIEHNPSVGFCASKMLLYHHRQVINSAGIIFFTVGTAMDRGWMALDGIPFDRPAYTMGACAGAALYRKSMLDDIGLFDEDFSPAYLEDVDLSLRAQLRGYRCLYVPSAVVYHRLGATLGYKSFTSVYLTARNQWYVLIKNIPTRLLLMHGPEIAVHTILRLCFHMVKGEGAPYLLGLLVASGKLPTMVKKRLEIQRLRTLSNRGFASLMTKGRLSADVMRVLQCFWRRQPWTTQETANLPECPSTATEPRVRNIESAEPAASHLTRGVGQW